MLRACRWFTLKDCRRSSSLSVLLPDGACDRYGFSVSNYSMEQLDATSHNHQLQSEVDGRVFVHVDGRHMGVGGYDSWSPNVDCEFTIVASKAQREFHTNFTLRATVM